MAKKNHREPFKKEEEFEQRIIDVARVTRVMAGGKRMKFRVCLAIGDKKGRVGMAIAKGSDITQAITKALNRAKKNVIKVPIVNETIIHPIRYKFKAATILLKPAKKGNGIKAGGPLRVICELAGIPNVTGKILGSNNKINIVRATLEAFKNFKIVNKKSQEGTDKKESKNSSDLKKENKADNSKSFKDKIKNIINKKDKAK